MVEKKSAPGRAAKRARAEAAKEGPCELRAQNGSATDLKRAQRKPRGCGLPRFLGKMQPGGADTSSVSPPQSHQGQLVIRGPGRARRAEGEGPRGKAAAPRANAQPRHPHPGPASPARARRRGRLGGDDAMAEEGFAGGRGPGTAAVPSPGGQGAAPRRPRAPELVGRVGPSRRRAPGAEPPPPPPPPPARVSCHVAQRRGARRSGARPGRAAPAAAPAGPHGGGARSEANSRGPVRGRGQPISGRRGNRLPQGVGGGGSREATFTAHPRGSRPAAPRSRAPAPGPLRQPTPARGQARSPRRGALPTP